MTSGTSSNAGSASPDPERQRLRYPRAARVCRRKHFDRVKAAATSVRDAVLRIGWAQRPDDEPGPARLGLAVGKRLGDAPRRNRIKRVLREAFRQSPGMFPAGIDIVVIPLDGRAAGDFARVQASLLHLASRVARQQAERLRRMRPDARSGAELPERRPAHHAPAPRSPGGAPRPGSTPSIESRDEGTRPSSPPAAERPRS